MKAPDEAHVARAEDVSGVVAWNGALAELPADCRDVYFTPNYHDLHTAEAACARHAMLIRRSGAALFVPGVRWAIEAPSTPRAWDLQSCNGYGGPLAAGDVTEDFLAEAWRAWRAAAAADGCVAAFFRLHLLLENERWLPRDAELRVDRPTVFVDLAGGVGDAWTAADSRHRNMVNKGRREQVVVEWDRPDAWRDFERLYADAMARLRAPAELRFPASYFARLRALPGAQLACVYSGGELRAAACFLFGSRWAHYHLSARAPDAANHLMNCVLQAGFERAADARLQGMHLGGGRTNAPDDDLLRFKLHAGGRTLQFKVARVIADRRAFEARIAEWRARAGREPAWLLGYRQPLPSMTPTSPV